MGVSSDSSLADAYFVPTGSEQCGDGGESVVVGSNGVSNVSACPPSAGEPSVDPPLNADGVDSSSTGETPGDAGINGELTMIGVEKIDENNYNPNRLGEADFALLVKASRRRGRNPTPIRVRPDGDRYTIINGAHNFRAAKEAGLTEVLCEVACIDEFEAMRETLDYNRHGKHDPVLEGLQYQRMMAQRELTQRGLAKYLDVSEGTIRGRLAYVEAAACCIGCEESDVQSVYSAHAEEYRKIAGWNRNQVNAFLGLPGEFRKRWWDAGAEMSVLASSFDFECEVYEEGDPASITLSGAEVIGELCRCGLHDLVDLSNWRRSLTVLGKIARWCGDRLHMRNRKAYARSVAELGLGVRMLDALPVTRGSQGQLEALLSPTQWREILRTCCAQTTDSKGREALIATEVQAALERAGHDPATALTNRQIRLLRVLQEDNAPQVIMNATWLTVEERHRLHLASRRLKGKDAQRALKAVIKEFGVQRARSKSSSKNGVIRQNVVTAFTKRLEELRSNRRKAAEDALFQNEDALRGKVLEWMRDNQALQGAAIGEVPACDVFDNDVRALSPGMLAFVAGMVLQLPSDVVAARWLDAAQR